MKYLGEMAVAALAAAALFLSVQAEARTVKLLYWNIQNGMWAEQEIYYEKFTQWIKKQNPDICVFTEAQSIYESGSSSLRLKPDDRVLPAALPDVAGVYGHEYTYVGEHRDDYPQAVTSKYPITNVARLSGNSDITVNHGAGHCRVDIDGTTINIVTAHLWPFTYGPKATTPSAQKVSTGNNEGDKHREREIQYICEQTISKSTDTENELWLMSGDFNAESILDQAYYSYPSSSTKFLANNYILNNTPYKDLVKQKHPNEFLPTNSVKTRRIDYVYGSPAVNATLTRADVYQDSYTERKFVDGTSFYAPSDHLPIIVEFTIPGDDTQGDSGIIFEDDFSWTDVDAVKGSSTLNNSTNEQALTPTIMNNLDHPGYTRVQGNKTGTDSSGNAVYEINNNGGCYVRKGLIKMGQVDIAAAILTPKFDGLGDDTADLEVTLQLGGWMTNAYGTTNAWCRDMSDFSVCLTAANYNEGTRVVPMDDNNISATAISMPRSNNTTIEGVTFKVTNFPNTGCYLDSNGKATVQGANYMEYGDDWNMWDPEVSTYTVKVKDAKKSTQLILVAGKYFGRALGTAYRAAGSPTSANNREFVDITGTEHEYGIRGDANRIGLKRITVKRMDNTTAVETLTDDADANAPVEYYNLQGMKVAFPEKGQLLIKRQGSKTIKIINE